MPSPATSGGSVGERHQDTLDLRADLRRITVPTLVVVGEDDFICDRQSARIPADGIAGARLAVISEAGHFPWVEQPLAFRAELYAFLSEIPPAE